MGRNLAIDALSMGDASTTYGRDHAFKTSILSASTAKGGQRPNLIS